jgi:hypothetical protein
MPEKRLRPRHQALKRLSLRRQALSTPMILLHL